MAAVNIAIDFDGTVVEHEYPRIGAEVPHAFMWLRNFQEAGARLILWTMRGYGSGLTEAVEFCRSHGIEFYGINSNPEQVEWTTSPKAYAHIYIDDSAIGCPLIKNEKEGGRPYVDWSQVGPLVMGMLSAKGGV
jgi:hypothetical protein